MSTKNIKRYFPIVCLTLAAVLGPKLTWAQPDPNNAPKAANPAPAPAPGNWGAMTPEQRQQAIMQMMQGGLRMFMTRGGFPEQKIQDAVVDFMTQQEKEREQVRDQSAKMVQALLNNEMKDEDVANQLANFRAAVDVMKGNREAALADFDAKIEYSRKPRLEAFLTMVGLLGDESSYMSGMMGSMVGLMANLGGGLGAGLAGDWGRGAAPPPAAAPEPAPAPPPPPANPQ